MEQSTRFVGMDVHKETIVVAVTATGEVGKATTYGTFPNTAAGLEKLVKRARRSRAGRCFLWCRTCVRSAAWT
jgi:transposase